MKLIAFLVAVAAALLLNRPFPPIVTMANQLTAIFGWGLVLLLAPAPAPQRSTLRAVAPLLAFFAVAAGACAIGIVTGSQASPPGIGVLGIIVLAAAVMLHGASAGASESLAWFRAFAISLVVAGVLCAFIAWLQVFAVESLDNDIIAIPMRRGRAGGNVGQPNQFADAMLWGLVALVPLARSWQAPAANAGRALLARAGWVAAALAMLLGVVLAGSRTAMVALVLMAVWGLADRHLARPLRVALVLAPVVAVAMQWIVGAWAHAHHLEVVMTDRSDVGITAFRGEIWGNALSLIKDQPWLGTGWGGFNFAWTLTPFSSRGAGLVDNVHDLPLQLAVELGVPVALLMMGLLFTALWKAFRRVWRLPGDAGLAARSTLMIVVVVGLHSMFEYPMWYAYLLLPTAWAFGLASGTATRVAPAAAEAEAPAAPLRAWRALGLLLMVVAASAWLDYMVIVDLFLPRSTSAPLVERIGRAQASPLFANQADYVAVTDMPLTPAMLPLVERASHVLLNGRLMFAWANLLHARGEEDKARYMAARLREFALRGPKPWFAPCDDPAVTVKPFQCLAPEHPVTWRDFR